MMKSFAECILVAPVIEQCCRCAAWNKYANNGLTALTKTFDAIVIGSGVGGMCAAALLAHTGRRVLLAEKRRYLGGRFSTVDHSGYKCATGGLAVPVGRDMELVCDQVGIPSGVKPSTRGGDVAGW